MTKLERFTDYLNGKHMTWNEEEKTTINYKGTNQNIMCQLAYEVNCFLNQTFKRQIKTYVKNIVKSEDSCDSEKTSQLLAIKYLLNSEEKVQQYLESEGYCRIELEDYLFVVQNYTFTFK